MDKTERLIRWNRILESNNPTSMKQKTDELLDDIKKEVGEEKNQEIVEFLKEMEGNLKEGVEEVHEQTEEMNFESLFRRQQGYGQLLQWYIQEKIGLVRDILYSENLIPKEVRKE